MSLKGKKILVGDNGENIKIYKPLRESVKVQKEGITIEYLQNIYSNYFLPLVGKDEKFSDIEVTRKIFKCKFSLFFLKCGYTEEEIIPQLVEWEAEGKVESEKVIDFDKNRNRRNKSDGRTME